MEVVLRENLKRLRAGEVTPTKLTEEALTRIRRSGTALNAFITVLDEEALERARFVEKNWSTFKNKRLAGLPLGIKDNMLMKGTRTTCGSKILSPFIAPENGTAVQRFLDEGAIILGKLNMDEFAMGSSNEHSAYGSVKNPWSLERVPGGSSGGSAAAVAASYVGGALGSDTGGSIRQPAALCGLVGLKPTYGRVSRYGLVAFASSLDQIGPLTWTVEDSALLLETIAGEDPKDSTTSSRSVPPYMTILEEAAQKGVAPRTIGISEEFLKEGLDSEVEAHVREAILRFKDLGYKVVEISLPNSKYAIAVYYIIATSEASSNLARFDGVKYGHRTKGSQTIHEMYSKTRSEGFGPEVKLRIMLGNFSLSSGYYDAYYKKASQVRALIAKDFDDAFQKCDVILTPTSPTTAFKFGEKSADPLQMYLSDIFTVSINLAGVCAMSLPCGYSKHGLPIGMQLIAPRFEETRLFEVGMHFQSATSFHKQRPRLFGGVQPAARYGGTSA